MFKRFMMNMNLKPRLMVYFILLSVVPVLLIGSFTYLICSQVILDMAEATAMESMELVGGEVESLLEDAWRLGVMVEEDITVQENMRREFATTEERYSADLRTSMDLAYISTYREEIFGLYVLGLNGGTFKSNSASFRVEDFRERPWYRQVLESEAPVWFAPHERSTVVKTVADRYISVGIPFVDKASGRSNGVILVEIEEDTITDTVEKALGGQGYAYYISDGAGNVLCPAGMENNSLAARLNSSIDGFLAGSAAGQSGSVTVPDGEYLITCRQLGQTGWRMVSALEKQAVTSSNRIIVVAVVSMLALAVVVSVLLAVYFAESVTRPLRRLTDLMAQVEKGDLSVEMKTRYSDEIGRLGGSFNAMVREMQLLIQQIYEHQDQRRRSELKALQSQINPHFLYNALDSVTWLLRMGRAADAQHMLEALSVFYMTSVSKGREIIPLSEELRNVESYLAVEGMLYPSKFTWRVQADESLLKYMTMKLLLQPLVENSIYHGVKASNRPVEICVTVGTEGEDILLEVADTGVGFAPERLTALRKALENQGDDDRQGYGLLNVHERIQMLYGEGYGMSVESAPGKGATVTLRIPRVKGEGQDVQGAAL